MQESLFGDYAFSPEKDRGTHLAGQDQRKESPVETPGGAHDTTPFRPYLFAVRSVWRPVIIRFHEYSR